MVKYERKAKEGWEEVFDMVVAKRAGLEEEIRKAFEKENARINTLLDEISEEVPVEYPDPVSTEDFDKKEETEEPLY